MALSCRSALRGLQLCIIDAGARAWSIIHALFFFLFFLLVDFPTHSEPRFCMLVIALTCWSISNIPPLLLHYLLWDLRSFSFCFLTRSRQTSGFSPQPGTLLQSGVSQLQIWDVAIIETMQTSITAAVQQGPSLVGLLPELKALSAQTLFKVIGLKPSRLPCTCSLMLQMYFQVHV